MHLPLARTALKKVIVSVTNDLSTDQRVDKVCCTLVSMGFQVLLVGRLLSESIAIQRKYTTKRFKLFFRKGPLFYAEYNIRLFLFLFFSKTNLLVSNDLDTLPANYLVHRIKKIPIVYDSHEYYTGTPELVNRPFIQGIWKRIEKFIFPKLNDIITVNESIASIYEQEYGKKLFVVRNIPNKPVEKYIYSADQLGFANNKQLIILQGAGINIERGAEEAILAMQYIKDATLLIIGGGDVIKNLKNITKERSLTEKVIFLPKMPYCQLMKYTSAAQIGLTLDKDTNINYRYSLPNKLFDYIHAGTPVLSSNLIEIRKIVEKYNVGQFIENHEPIHIAHKINMMLQDNSKEKLKENLSKACDELNWENEEIVLKAIYSKYV